MQLKKEVIRKRMEAQLTRIAQKRTDHANAFPAHKEAYLEQAREWIGQLEKTQSWSDWHRLPSGVSLRSESYIDEFSLSQREKLINRNIQILDAIEGDVIEVTALKTGRGLALETLFDETI